MSASALMNRALMNRALMNSALMNRALMNRALMPVHLAAMSLRTLALRPLALLALSLLGRRLVHQVQDPKIVLGVLQIPFRHDPVAAAGRVAAKLQIFLKQLLSRAAHPQIRAVAVENMVSVERDATPGVVAHRATTTTATAATSATTAGAMVAATHAFHVHTVAVVLSRYGAA